MPKGTIYNIVPETILKYLLLFIRTFFIINLEVTHSPCTSPVLKPFQMPFVHRPV